MTLQLFLNDLSIPDETCAHEVAMMRLNFLVDTLRAAGKIGRNFIINADRPFAELTLGKDRPLAVLRNEPACADARVYLKTLVDRSPWTQALAQRPADPAGGAEYRMPPQAQIHAGAEAVALGLSHELSGLAISLASHAHWDAATVAIVRTVLDAQANLVGQAVTARNASCPEHVDGHAYDLAALLVPPVSSGAELWARRGELLPNLAWAPTTRGQLESLQEGDPNLKGAMERLFELDASIAAWRGSGGPRPVYPFSVSPESRNRINAGLCDIKDENGTVRTFSDHARYGPDENRVHFLLQTEPVRHVIIGHVGRKLGIG